MMHAGDMAYPKQVPLAFSSPPDALPFPNCSFGQHRLRASKPVCGRLLAAVDALLRKAGIVYFVRSGSELGVVRQSTLLGADGDIDIYARL